MSEYSLYLGDCLEYMKSMPDKSVDAVITDPPYGIFNHDRLIDRAQYSGAISFIDTKIEIDEVNFNWDELLIAIDKVFCSWLYIFAGHKTDYIRSYFHERDCMTRTGVWEKSNIRAVNGQWMWLSTIETFAIIRKRHAIFNEFCKSPIWRIAIEGNREHPTQKPVKLISEFIKASTNPGGTIFDPFMGSGTTGVACMQLGRNFIGCEIDPTYYAIAEKRIKEAAAQIIMELK